MEESDSPKSHTSLSTFTVSSEELDMHFQLKLQTTMQPTTPNLNQRVAPRPWPRPQWGVFIPLKKPLPMQQKGSASHERQQNNWKRDYQKELLPHWSIPWMQWFAKLLKEGMDTTAQTTKALLLTQHFENLRLSWSTTTISRSNWTPSLLLLTVTDAPLDAPTQPPTKWSTCQSTRQSTCYSTATTRCSTTRCYISVAPSPGQCSDATEDKAQPKQIARIVDGSHAHNYGQVEEICQKSSNAINKSHSSTHPILWNHWLAWSTATIPCSNLTPASVWWLSINWCSPLTLWFSCHLMSNLVSDLILSPIEQMLRSCFHTRYVSMRIRQKVCHLCNALFVCLLCLSEYEQ